jgi:hypothetical protein
LIIFVCYIVFLWFVVVVTLVELNWIDSLNIESSNCADAARDAARDAAQRIVLWVARSGGATAAQKGCSPKCYENYSSRFPEGVQKEKSNNDDKHGHGQEKRRPTTLS